MKKKTDSNWHRFKCLELDCAIHLFQRESTADTAKADVFHCGNKSIALDNTLNPELARLMPKGYAHAKPHHWAPFLQTAIAKGIL